MLQVPPQVVHKLYLLMPWLHGKGKERHFLPVFIPPFRPVTGCLVRLCLPKRHTSFLRLLAGLCSYMTEFLSLRQKQGYCEATCGTFPGKAAGKCIHSPFFWVLCSILLCGNKATIWVHEKKGHTLRTVAPKFEGSWVTEDLMGEMTCSTVMGWPLPGFYSKKK